MIVRVKRRRDHQPAESLCIVEDNEHPRAKKTASESMLSEMGQLSTTGVGSSGSSLGRSIVLRRVTTMSSVLGTQMDAVVSSLQDAPQQFDAQTSGGGSSSASMWITQGKSMYQSQADGSNYVVVDMSQVKMRSRAIDAGVGGGIEGSSAHSADSPASIASTSPASGAKRCPVLDPPTRKLEAAIETALVTGDFNAMAYALQQGPNVNHQRPQPEVPIFDPRSPLCGGETALMAAAKQGNVRMLERLLSLGVDVFAADALGRTAIDLARVGPAQSTSQEICLKLHTAAIRAQRPGDQAAANGSGAVDDPEYEFDVFFGGAPGGMAYSDQPSSLPLAGDASMQVENGAPASTTTHAAASGMASSWEGLRFPQEAQAPVVCVDGLRFVDNGLVELVAAYDSDWSDLGDDEDPDSNDERYHGNDYPDDEDDDGEEEEEPDSDIERHLGIGRADLDSECEEDEHRLGIPGARTRAPRADEDDEDYGAEEDDSGNGDDMPGGGESRFERQPIGRVVRPTIQGGDSLLPTHTRESIRALWGETGGLDDEDEDFDGGDEGGDEGAVYGGIARQGYTLRDRFSASGHGMGPGQGAAMAHIERLKKMRSATGMDFGAVPREFTTGGLAKFGMELSDDDDDDGVYGAGSRPPPGSLAYDPDLDDYDDM